MISPHPRFWSTLAGLRFLFAMWVLFDHTYNFGPTDRAIPVLTKSGLMAVMCFFVISGFSIRHSIETKPTGYLRRRFRRIFPINAAAVFIGWFAWSVLGLSGGYGTPPFKVTTRDFIANLLLLEAFLPVMIPFFFPAWSLSVEVLYYACAPLLQWLNGGRIIPLLMITSCVFFAAWPFIKDEYIAANRSYELAAIGMLWAWLAGWIAYGRRGDRIYVVALIFGGLMGLWSQAKYFGIVDFKSAAVNCIAWVGMLLIVFYRLGRIRSARFAALLEYLGEISYPIYLLHYPVLFLLTSSLLKTYPQFNNGVVHVVVALLAGALAYRYVDKPLRAFGSRAKHLDEWHRRQDDLPSRPEPSAA
jgi:peptidoglycan/LPS O-acetylase OafA/YrhL